MALSRFRILQKRCHLIISLIRNLRQDFFLDNKPMVDSNFAFIDPVSAFNYGGSDWFRAFQNDYVSLITLNLLYLDGHILLLWINIICTKNLHHIVC